MSALAALLVLLLASPPDPGLVSRYPGAESGAIGTVLRLGGSEARLAYFTTADTPARVIEHFTQRWTEQGLPVTVDDDGQSAAIVSAFHTLTGVQQSVIVSRHGVRTVGLAVALNLWSGTTAPKPASEVRAPGEVLFVQASRSECRKVLEQQARASGLALRILETSPDGLVLEHRGAGRAGVTVLVSLAAQLTAVWQLEEPR